jgi:hypothetical protein
VGTVHDFFFTAGVTRLKVIVGFSDFFMVKTYFRKGFLQGKLLFFLSVIPLLSAYPLLTLPSLYKWVLNIEVINK